MTQNKNGEITELINTDQDFELNLGPFSRRDTHIWTFEGNNTLLFKSKTFN